MINIHEYSNILFNKVDIFHISCIVDMMKINTTLSNEMGQVGGANSAMPIRRGQLGAANSTLGQFGTGSTRRRRFSAGTFWRIVSNRDIKIINELKNYRNHMSVATDVQDKMNCNLIYSVIASVCIHALQL